MTGIVGVSLVIFGVLGSPIYVFPRSDPEAKSDVVYVIGPPDAAELSIATAMMRKGLASELLISVNDRAFDNSTGLGLCVRPQKFRVTCVTPEPFTTQGEARLLTQISQKRGWTTATVITGVAHVSRTRLLMGRCFTGDLYVIGTPSRLNAVEWAGQYLYQSGAFIKAALSPNC
ncbi:MULTISPECIES: YdcF family protein [unclassified Cryobacterium]|uniref:YdcF family protein n=1 Tax=unclassified Cryobacterium TaxID=2649013 RepID=UPI00106BAF40|nr:MULTISPECIES: YdcF family protein [Cryobacterium]MEA9999665.1 YdcF family protein [Cryobacterium sp. RTS3]MEC5151132.1 hypothetical protein [Cryobacterium psychrotolerans]TFC05199.1 YdcF family protein [Cryobacterium sp. MDB2-33-2]